ncbi:DUF2247 family protein [Saccharothrix sp. NPDC042600]|uniref:DUF2247 family protein n=1 Tax=Saccharothrix TaxID=2071 RepID=UPI0033E82F95|nr:hypothetical protein GCM10017745_47810 [Saccharothrix mutabilis subsp. capreolus]
MFRIPAAFIVQRVRLTPSEISYGRQHGWIDDNATVEICLEKLNAGLSSELEEEWALTLSIELAESKPEEFPADPTEDASAVWVYLSVAWLHHSGPPNLLRDIEAVYAHLDYPAEMEAFVGYMPPPPGGEVGPAAVTRRLESLLRSAEASYRRRDGLPHVSDDA